MAKASKPVSDVLNETPETPASSNDLVTALLQKQTELMAQLQANQPKRKPSQLEVIQRQTHWKEFKYPVYQNGYEAQADGLSDESIQRAATLAPGRYLNDVVEVVRTGRDKTQKIHLFYDTKGVDARIRLKNYFSSFSDLLKKIHDEMKARNIAPVE